jgi:tetratricopeptide (TPR) repeat protein
MNREKWLFVIVLVIVLAWGGLRLGSAYEAEPVPPGRTMNVAAPDVRDYASVAEEKRFTRVLTGAETLATAVPERGRTVLLPFSDLDRLDPIMLPVPRDLPTPVVLPPIRLFPGTVWFRWFRSPPLPVMVAAAPDPAETDVPIDDGDEDEETDAERALREEDAIKSRGRFTFKDSEWDLLVLVSGSRWYGTLSMLKEQKDANHTKFELLLPENAAMPFYFEQIDTANGRVQTTGTMSRESSNIREIVFADTIENRYWARRVQERVKEKDPDALMALGRWVMDLADLPNYSRPKGLALAVAAFELAMTAANGSVESVLWLGEALHRSFRFDEELSLYDRVLAEKASSPLQARRARIFRKLGLPDLEFVALEQALAIAPGDVQSRLRRGDALLVAGEFQKAMTDFAEAERIGTAEEQVAGREGRGRALVLQGRPKDALTLLASATDAASLTTLGSAHYALKQFAEARAVFEKAVAADPLSADATTGLGFAMAHTATDAAGLEAGLAMLEKARGLCPLNYFYPPLGQGFTDARLDRAVASQDWFLTAARAMPANPYVHYALGMSYLRDGRFADARVRFLKALEADYRFADCLLGAGTASVELREFAKARQYFDRALTLELRALADAGGDPERQAAARDMVLLLRFRLGRTWLISEDVAEKDRLKQAKDQFEKLVALDSRFVPALIALGTIAYHEGDADGAQAKLDLARDLAHPGEDREQAESLKVEIIRRENMRRWRDDFDRPSSGTVGNGWTQTTVGAMQPKIRDGNVVVSGRMESAGTIWLARGEKGLNEKFISAQAGITTGIRDRVEVWFVVFQRRGQGAGSEVTVGTTVGVGRNMLGELVQVERKASDKTFTSTVVVGPDGQPRLWPEGEVLLRVERTDPEEGTFAIFVNGDRVGTAPVGLRQKGGDVELGFLFTANVAEQIDVSVSGVEMIRFK